MSGHNKWSQIKHKKGVTDAKKSANFTRLGNLIALAAREGGDDPNTNYRLKIAVDQAKNIGVPKDNIDRAIKRGSGALGGAQIESALYELYGPLGVGFLIETATDNKNRTIMEVKAVANKHHAKQASSGSVKFQFSQVGRIIAKFEGNEEDGELVIIDSGARDYNFHEDQFFIYCDIEKLAEIKKSLENQKFEIEEYGLIWEPNTTVLVVSQTDQEKIEKLTDSLLELNDVTGVYHNGELKS